MKQPLRWGVFVMCIAFLLSLFGCGKGQTLDGPGMERGVWSEFTLMRYSEHFGTVYSYTVKYDSALDEAQLSTADGNSVPLEKSTINALFALNLLELPASEVQVGTFLDLSVTDQNGQLYNKQIGSAREAEILALLTPYLSQLQATEEPFMLDGPDMGYRPPWTAFSLSRTDSNTRYVFWFTVTDTETDTLLMGECQDSEGKRYQEEAGISLPVEAWRELQQMDLEQLPDAEPWPVDLPRPEDDSCIKLSVTLADGTVVEKQAFDALSMEIYELLLPYFVNNQN